MTAGDPLSPCEKVCTLNPANNICMGCFRSAAEIRAWPDYSPAEKHAVLKLLPPRRQARRRERQALAPSRRRKT